MLYLKKTWIRILLSLFLGGIVMEIIAINSADPNFRHTPKPSSLGLIVAAAIFYMILTAYVKRKTRGY